MDHAFLIPALACVFGLAFGSFLNVVIARLPAGESVLTPRSKCPVCAARLRWYDNIPLLSYVVLRGRCRDCRARISWRYPAVEMAMAAWWAISFLPLAHSVSTDFDSLLQILVACASTAVLGWFLLGIAVIDWKHYRVPNELTYSGVFAGLLFACAQALFLNDNQADVVLQHPIHINSANAGRSTGNIFLTGPEHIIFGRLLAAVAAFLLLYGIGAVYKLLRKRDGMGLGDAKLLAMIAAFLGMEATGVCLALGIVLATGYAVFLLVRRHASATTRLPFGSFLAVAGMFSAVYGPRLADQYLRLFR